MLANVVEELEPYMHWNLSATEVSVSSRHGVSSMADCRQAVVDPSRRAF